MRQREDVQNAEINIKWAEFREVAFFPRKSTNVLEMNGHEWRNVHCCTKPSGKIMTLIESTEIYRNRK